MTNTHMGSNSQMSVVLARDPALMFRGLAKGTKCAEGEYMYTARQSES